MSCDHQWDGPNVLVSISRPTVVDSPTCSLCDLARVDADELLTDEQREATVLQLQAVRVLLASAERKLAKYGRHLTTCESSWGLPCSCGFSA